MDGSPRRSAFFPPSSPRFDGAPTRPSLPPFGEASEGFVATVED